MLSRMCWLMVLWVLGTSSLTAATHEPRPCAPEAAKTAEFSLRFRDSVSPYDVIGIFAMPGEIVELEAVFVGDDSTFEVDAAAGRIERVGHGEWKWHAPSEPGYYPLSIKSTPSDHVVRVNAFVKVPFSEIKGGQLGEFRVGTYPEDDEFGKRSRYERPDGFVQVDEQTHSIQISPHFTLGHFVSKQKSEFPKFVFLRERLLLKLELLHSEFNQAGIDTRDIHVMSGYRTPFYNRAIGNVKFSRHVFGDAADIFIDNDGNGRMDDLNSDGASNLQDAKMLAEIVEALVDQPHYAPFIGGLGVYGSKPHRGPFIHVDTRGYRARWTNP